MQEKISLTQPQETSGLMIFDTGSESLQARLAIINSARHTIDLQYYAINNDVTSNLLIEAVIRAAERGVKVRFLIDDISVGKVYKGLSVLDSIPNIHVRIFNPITRSLQNFPSRFMAFLAHLPRATKRMHNKAIIVDNHRGIIGGRNLGDEYFDAHSDKSFKDIDVLASGVVTGSMSESFLLFWNSSHSVPVSKLYDRKIGKHYIKKFRRKLNRNWNKALKDKHNVEILFDDFLKGSEVPVVESKAFFVADKPDKIDDQTNGSSESPIYAIRDVVDKASRDFLIVSPYFVPMPRGLAWLLDLRKRGLKIEVLTNSLASTDVVAVHTGYESYRADLIRNDVKLYEMKPINGRTKQRWIGKGAPSYASLHAKVYVVDGKTSIIGSLNFDPRSVSLNTELALVIESEVVAQKLLSLYRDVTSPDYSYALSFDKENIVWKSREDGKDKTYYRDPKAGFWRRIQAVLIGMLPVEKQL